MNNNDHYSNSLFLLRLLGHELICVNEDLFKHVWAWSFDLTTEHSYPADYSQQQVSILTTPNLYDAKNFELTRQALHYGQDWFPKFEHWLKANAIHVLLDEKILTQALNKLVFIARRELETQPNVRAAPSASPVEADPSVVPNRPQEQNP